MPNNYLSVLYKHIIQVENENVGLKVGGGVAQTYNCPKSKKGGPPCPAPPPPPTLPTPVSMHFNTFIQHIMKQQITNLCTFWHYKYHNDTFFAY